MHAHRHLLPGGLRNRHELHHVAEIARGRDVVGGDAGDPLGRDVARDHTGAEGEGGQDRQLRGCIGSLDVGGGIGLGIAEPLCFRQSPGEGPPRLGHAREDEVGRPVHDPHHLANAVPRQRLSERADDRDPSTDGRLEQHVDSGISGRLQHLAAGRGEKLFVRRHDVLAGPDGTQDQVARGL